ncbi:MAG: hypothetical protein MUD11_12800 [Rhodobacteraceae bacterium]|jgi:hypothetical protein|nr:hypothetical protein [Paracoccaceae bacterium]
MRCVALCLALIAPPALADSFAGWTFDPPDGYELTPGTFGVAYQGPNGGYIFAPVTPATNARAAAAAFADEGLPIGSQRNEITTEYRDDGTEASFWIVSDGAVNYLQMTLVKDGQSSTALFVTPLQDANLIAAETEALLDATFAPPETVLAPATSTLPPVTFPAPPPADRMATTRSRMTIAQARAAGVDPDLALLPGTFDCYLTSEPRAVDARPDLRIISDLGQRYTLTDGRRSQSGTWSVQPHDTFDQVIQLSAPIDDYILIHSHDGLGQSFTLNHPERDADLTCVQDGPPLEAQLQTMAAIAPTKGAMDCTGVDGSTFKLLYGNGTYIVNGQRGSYVAALDGNYNNWRGKLTFQGGPYDLLDGELEAKDGTQTLTISETWTEGSLFYSSSETTYTAICRSPAPARLPPLYGPDAAPTTADPSGGLPEGLYRSFEGRMEFNGTMANYVIREIFTLIAPGGRIMVEPDLDLYQSLPDCSRTTPSGEEVCGEYRTIGPQFSYRNARDFDVDAWSANAPFALTDTGYTVGDIAYTRVLPPTPDDLTGQWVADDFTGGGPGLGGGVGVYTDSDTRWTFTADGRFDWYENSTTSTLISPDPILGGVSGGGSSSSVDGGTGTFTLDDIWLDLRFDDGRSKRVPVFFLPANADSPAALTVGGAELKPF